MNVVVFGAGNVGRGFLGLETYLLGYDVTFVDVDKKVVDCLRKNKEYEVNFFQNRASKNVKVKNAFHLDETDLILGQLQKTDIVLTAVGTNNLKYIAPIISKGIQKHGKQLIVACENTPNNTQILKSYVDERIPHSERYAEFANCVIDRICLRKNGNLFVEPNFEWVVETSNDLLGGIDKTNNLEPYFTRKLFLVNCAHAIIGYVGHHENYVYVHEALSNRNIRQLVDGSLRESSFGLSSAYRFGQGILNHYIQKTMDRLSNPEISDDIQRVVRNPIRKLHKGERLVGPAVLAYKYGLVPQNLCRAVKYLLMYRGDYEGKELQSRIRTVGVRKTLEEYTELKRNHFLISKIASEYEKL